MLRAFIKDNRGVSEYIGTMISILVVMCFVLTIVSLLPIFTTKADVDYMTQQAVRTIELTGKKGDEYTELVADLDNAFGAGEYTLAVEGNFVTSGGIEKIQLRDKFTVTLTVPVGIPIITPAGGEPVVITINVAKSLTGRSEIYWKDLA